MTENFVKKHIRGEYTVLEVDTTKANYQGIAWKALGDLGKRKFDNFLFLSNMKDRGRVKIIYNYGN